MGELQITESSWQELPDMPGHFTREGDHKRIGGSLNDGSVQPKMWLTGAPS